MICRNSSKFEGGHYMRSMNKKKTLLATSLASAGLVGILLVGGVAFAQTSQGGNNGLAQAIASKFNLNKDDVQKVIDQQHQDMMKQHLDKLVKAGKITQDQEDKIIAKLLEMKPKIEAARALPDPAARKKALEALQAEMQQWEKDNNIPKGVLGPVRGHRMMKHAGASGEPQTLPDDTGSTN